MQENLILPQPTTTIIRQQSLFDTLIPPITPYGILSLLDFASSHI